MGHNDGQPFKGQRMKALWLSSVQLSEKKLLGSGTWVPGMLAILKQYFPELEIVNLTKARVSSPVKINCGKFSEWIIPTSEKMTSDVVKNIHNVIKQEKPDVIQVWGTEDIWGLFPFKEYFSQIPYILEIQGILASVSEEYYGGLTPWDLIKCWNIKECIKPSSSLPAIRRLYTKNIGRERLILENTANIGVQSDWSASVVKTYNPTARLYRSGIAIRPAFYQSAKWAPGDRTQVTVFSTALMGQPLKGAYILFKAFAIIRQRYPDAQLVLAGAKEDGLRRSGFCRMLTRFARKHNFLNAIHQLGILDASNLAEQYRRSSVFVNPSNWESYSVVTAESMYIGCPTVAAYSGALPELGENNSVLYFPKGDYRICASHVIDILDNLDLAKNLSFKSIAVAERRQDRYHIAANQLNTYKQLIENHQKN